MKAMWIALGAVAISLVSVFIALNAARSKMRKDGESSAAGPDGERPADRASSRSGDRGN